MSIKSFETSEKSNW